MNNKQLAVLLICVFSCVTASADNPLRRLFDCQRVPDCVGRWCPDDYCSKKEPCVCVPLRFQCDDYCSKKEPCVCPGFRFTCDDYCKKCLPKACSSPRCDLLGCGWRTCSSSPMASQDKSSEQESAQVTELPELLQMSYLSAADTVGGESDEDGFDRAWQPVTVEFPDFPVGD